MKRSLLYSAAGAVLFYFTLADNETNQRQQPKDLSIPPSLLSAMIASFSMIVSSEIGDKTFFIAAIMSMRHGRQIIFIGAMSALIIMTILSALLGSALPTLLPRKHTHIAAIALFTFFGIKLLKEAFFTRENDGIQQELEETEAELNALNAKRSEEYENDDDIIDDLELAPPTPKRKKQSILWSLVSPALIQAFTMTFLAEWGDRSQIATIVMAADINPIGVVVGGILGHAVCTLMAVMGGKILAARVSERTVHTIGGFLFLGFAVHSLISESGVM